jgi:hypothetical protein
VLAPPNHGRRQALTPPCQWYGRAELPPAPQQSRCVAPPAMVDGSLHRSTAESTLRKHPIPACAPSVRRCDRTSSKCSDECGSTCGSFPPRRRDSAGDIVSVHVTSLRPRPAHLPSVDVVPRHGMDCTINRAPRRRMGLRAIPTTSERAWRRYRLLLESTTALRRRPFAPGLSRFHKGTPRRHHRADHTRVHDAMVAPLGPPIGRCADWIRRPHRSSAAAICQGSGYV